MFRCLFSAGLWGTDKDRFNPHNNSMRQILVFVLFCRRGNLDQGHSSGRRSKEQPVLQSLGLSPDCHIIPVSGKTCKQIRNLPQITGHTASKTKRSFLKQMSSPGSGFNLTICQPLPCLPRGSDATPSQRQADPRQASVFPPGAGIRIESREPSLLRQEAGLWFIFSCRLLSGCLS